MNKKLYYILDKRIIDEDIMGCWPQSEKNEPLLYYEERKRLHALSWKEIFPETIPGLNGNIVLSKKAKLTDIITSHNYSSLSGLTLSLKAQNLMEGLNIELGRFYKTSILWKKKKIPFSLIYLLPSYDLIDYQKTDSVSEHLMTSEKEFIRPLKITSLEEFHSQRDILQKESLTIRQKKLVIKREVDIFMLPLSPSIFVSEKLKDIFESNNITGLGYEKPFCDVFV